MKFSDEQLIAFLLGDSGDELARQISEVADNDLTLQARLAELQEMLDFLPQTCEVFEPPIDLVEKTLERVEQLKPTTHSAGHRIGESCLSDLSEPPPIRRNAWDTFALTVALTILGCMVLPTVVRARFESRKLQCAAHLQSLGQSILEFATLAPDHRIPEVPQSGPTSFAGFYSVQLNDRELLDGGQQLHCPSLAIQSDNFVDLKLIPSEQEILQLDDSTLSYWKSRIGGNYAFNLGVVEGDSIKPVRFEGRSRFALLADSPQIGPRQETLVAHEGKGSNVLFEDGSVSFLSYRALKQNELLDHPLRNDLGKHKAGLNLFDASVAPSSHSPNDE